MIISEFENGAGLGNQLWVYASMRGISKFLKTNFALINYDNFKGKNFLILDQGSYDKSIDYSNFYEKLFYDKNFNTLICDYDHSITKISGNVKINGIFQSEKYFYGEIELLSQWIRPTDRLLELSKRYHDKIVVNIRGGEYKRYPYLILPNKYWYTAINIMIDKFPNKEVIVVTDDRHFAKSIFPKYNVVYQSIEECYAALYGAKSLILSNSSFSYFPIKTRKDNPFVIAPKHWARYNNPYHLWISPANFYSNWNYLDDQKILKTYEQLKGEVNKTINYYNNNYKVMMCSNKTPVNNKYYYIPKKFKNFIKIFLKFINPVKF